MTTVYMDLETGGVQEHHPDIQLAAIAISEESGEELGHFDAKIQFDESTAQPEALKMNHYDREVWRREAKPVPVVVGEFARFLGNYKSLQLVSKRTGQPYGVAKLCGHNAASFDGPRLRRMFEAVGAFCPWDPRVRDTLQLAMWYCDLTGEKPASYRLEALCQHFAVEVDSSELHDALADVRASAKLARAISLRIQGRES